MTNRKTGREGGGEEAFPILSIPLPARALVGVDQFLYGVRASFPISKMGK